MLYLAPGTGLVSQRVQWARLQGTSHSQSPSLEDFDSTQQVVKLYGILA